MRRSDVTRGVVALITPIAAACGLAASGAAASSSGWQFLSGGPGAPGKSDDPSLYRTRDGVLHVLWVLRQTPESLVDTSVAPSGAVSMHTIAAGWNNIADGEMIEPFTAHPSDAPLTAVFGGLVSATGGIGPSLNAATLGGDGNWLCCKATPRAYGVLSIARSTDFQGEEVGVVEANSQVRTFRLDSAGFDMTHSAVLSSGAADGSPNIVSHQSVLTGTVAAWCSFGDNVGGIYVQQVDPNDASAAGPPLVLPGSTTAHQGKRYSTCVLQTEASRRMPEVGTTNGMYVAGATGYPTLAAVKVWRVRVPPTGTTGLPLTAQVPLTAVSKPGVAHVEPQLAADDDDRIWVGWVQSAASGSEIVVRRSNPAGTVLGAPVSIPAPRGLQIGSFEASATTSALDLIGQLSDAKGNASLQRAIALPGLTLQIERVRRLANGSRRVSFRVLDAGAPVMGANVTAGGHHARTRADGRTVLVVRGHIRGRATKNGYTPGNV